MSKILSYGIAFLLGQTLLAQGVKLSFHHLDQSAGLPIADNYRFSQDSRGFVWIGTAAGLCRFDGKNLLANTHDPSNPNSISENLVTSACFEDGNGDLWFSTFGSLQCYHWRTGLFENWSLPGSSLKHYYVFHLAKNGPLWLRIGSGEEGVLYWFDLVKKTFTAKCAMEGNRAQVVADANGKPTHLLETQLPSRGGLVWRTLETGLGNYFEFLKDADGQSIALSTATNAAIVESEHLIWVAVYDGIGVFDPSTGKTEVEVGRTPGIPAIVGYIYGMTELDPQHLLVTCNYGLLVFDKQKKAFVQHIQYQANDSYSPRDEAYEELYADPTGNIWLSWGERGISFANLKKKKFESVLALSGAAVSALYADKNGNIWSSTEKNGTYLLDAQKRVLRHSQKLENLAMPEMDFDLLPVSHFHEDNKGNVWGAYENNLFLWRQGKTTPIFCDSFFLGPVNSPFDKINCYLKLQSGEILAAKGREVLVLSTSLEKVNLKPWYDLSPYHFQVITALFQDKNGRVYIADETERLLVFEQEGKVLHLQTEWKEVGACHHFLEQGDSLLFAATTKGLLKIERSSGRARLLNLADDGIPSELYYVVLADKNNLLWLSGNNGLLRYDPLAKTSNRFGKADGLALLGASMGTFITSSTGEFWLGGKNGLNVFRPEEVKLLNTAPPVHITQIFVNDQISSTHRNETIPLKVDYQHNTLSFQFAVLDFSDPNGNQFYFRLQGFENDWVSNGNNNFVRYPNLPPGTYTFQVKASNSDGVMNDAVCSLKIVISPPFWQTWWFYLLCVLATAGIIYGWFMYRLQQALKIERMRVQISSDLHDDVGTLLAGLAMQSEALELTAPEKDKSKLKRISEISRNAMAHMRDTVWAIDARKDKLENLLDRMREHAEETLTPRDIRFDIQVDNLSLKQNLPTNIRQNIYLLYKEAITNAAKHTNGDMVTVSLKKTGEGFEMRICDNGQVEEKGYKTTGLGTSNMQMRAEKIGGNLEITREDGFCVVLRMGGLG